MKNNPKSQVEPKVQEGRLGPISPGSEKAKRRETFQAGNGVPRHETLAIAMSQQGEKPFTFEKVSYKKM